MEAIWQSMGYIRYPIAFSLVAVVLLTAYSATRVFGAWAPSDLRTKAWLDAILFWGGFAAISGVLGTLVGFILAAQAIEAVGTVSSALVWGGIKVALLSSAVGMVILALASLSWFGLQLAWRLSVAEE